ncbi:hypothetical protein EDC01DRAFT_674436 [Geopyxis carbonaria]|nr:hypothetical protein EDC01DRAFT_674436 [Geopyxis carbonaria]
MTEPIGVIASVAGIIKATQELCRIINGIAEAPDFLCNLGTQLESLEIVLHEISFLGSTKRSTALNNAITHCRSTLRSIGISLEPLKPKDSDGSARVAWKRLRTAIKKETLEGDMGRLEVHKNNLNTALVMTVLKSTAENHREIKDDFQEMRKLTRGNAGDLHDILLRLTRTPSCDNQATNLNITNTPESVSDSRDNQQKSSVILTKAIERSAGLAKMMSLDEQEFEIVKKNLESLSHQDLSRVQELWNPKPAAIPSLKSVINDIHCKKFLRALKTPLYEEDRLGVKNASRNTGEWILETAEYLDWIRSKKSTVFHLEGKPASGKSVLAKKILQQLSNTTEKELAGTTLTMYYFCNNRQRPEESASNFLKAFIHQFFHCNEGNPRFEDLVENCSVLKAMDLGDLGEKDFQFSLKSLWKMFKTTVRISGLQKIFIVLDALDECERSSALYFVSRLPKLMNMNSSLGPSEGPILKLFMTSRIENEISEELAECSPIVVPLRPETTRQDIDSVVKERLSRLNKRLKMSAEKEESLRNRLVERSEGMFLWAVLAIQEMENSRGLCPETLESILESFPKTLRKLYDHILEDLTMRHPKHSEIVLLSKIFGWVTGAARPMTLDELEIAIALSPESKSLRDIESRRVYNIAGEIRRIPFLEIVEPGASPDELGRFQAPCQKEEGEPSATQTPSSSTVRLVHQSAKEYLLEFQSRLHEIGQLNNLLIPEFGHAEMGILCITFLKFEELKEGVVLSRGEQVKKTISEVLEERIQSCGPFMKYAVLFWGYHLEKISEGHAELAKFVCTFVCNSEMHNNLLFWFQASSWLQFRNFINYFHIFTLQYFTLQYPVTLDLARKVKVSGLHAVATVDLTWMVKYFIDEGHPLNEEDWERRTAYYIARVNGHHESARLLLKAGAEEKTVIDTGRVYDESSPLKNMAIDPHTSADDLKSSLQSEADLEAVNWLGQTVAHFACASNNPNSIRAVIDVGVDMTKKDFLGRAPLDVVLDLDARKVLLDHLDIALTTEDILPECATRLERYTSCGCCGVSVHGHYYHCCLCGDRETEFNLCLGCSNKGGRCFDNTHSLTLRFQTPHMVSWVQYSPWVADPTLLELFSEIVHRNYFKVTKIERLQAGKTVTQQPLHKRAVATIKQIQETSMPQYAIGLGLAAVVAAAVGWGVARRLRS